MGVNLHEQLNKQPVIKPYVEMNNKPVESEILECVNKYVEKTSQQAECDPFSDVALSLMKKILGVDLNVKPFGPDGFNNFVAKRDRNFLLLKRFAWKRLTKR